MLIQSITMCRNSQLNQPLRVKIADQCSGLRSIARNGNLTIELYKAP